MNKPVVYTAVFGGFEKKVPRPIIISDAEYMCFSDGCVLDEPWRLKKTESSEPTSRRDNRKHKILSHISIPEAEYTIYVDGNFEIRVSVEEMLGWLGGNDIALLKHPWRGSLYDEAVTCKKLWPQEPIDEQVRQYQEEGCPKERQLLAGCVIVRRHTDQIKELNELWWEQLNKFSCRDQISLPYALWKTGVKCSYIPLSWQEYANEKFKYLSHGSLS